MIMRMIAAVQTASKNRTDPKARHVTGDQDLVTEIERKAGLMMAPQFVSDPAGP